MDIFKPLPNLGEEKLHPKFKLLRDDLAVERNIITTWAQDFIDRDNKIVEEFQATFHSSFFEFYLYSYLKSQNFLLNSQHYAPDFILLNPHNYIEAVVANIKQNGPQEHLRTVEDLFSMLTPPWKHKNFPMELDEAIVRCSNALHYKSEKYLKEYTNLSWINKNVPFSIAIASFDQINYGREFIYPMMALLYGLYFDSNNKTYVKRNTIIKPGTNSEIDIGLFLKPEYKHISAIIFTCSLTLGKLTSLAISNNNFTVNQVYIVRENCSGQGPHYQLQIVTPDNPELLSDGLFVFHNPLADNPFDETLFQMTTQFFYENGEIMISGIETPIVSRLNIFPNTIPFVEITEAIRAYNQLGLLEFYDFN